MPVVCTTNALIQIVAPCRKLWNIRSCSFPSRSSSSPSMRRDRFPWSHCSADHGNSPVAVHFDKVFDVPVCGSTVSTGAVVEMTAELPSFSMQMWRRRSRSHSCNVDAGHRCSHVCRLRNDRCRGWSRQCRKLWSSAVGTYRLAWFFRAVYTGTRPG